MEHKLQYDSVHAAFSDRERGNARGKVRAPGKLKQSTQRDHRDLAPHSRTIT